MKSLALAISLTKMTCVRKSVTIRKTAMRRENHVPTRRASRMKLTIRSKKRQMATAIIPKTRQPRRRNLLRSRKKRGKTKRSSGNCRRKLE